MAATSKFHTKKITARFLQIMNEVTGTRSSGKIPVSEFGQIVGVSGSNLTRMYAGSNFVTVESIAKMCMHFKVSETWLISGLGPKYNTEISQNSATKK